MKPTIITIGNGGYNIAADMIYAGLFRDYKLIVCDTDAEDLERNSASAHCSFLLDSSIEMCHLKNHHSFRHIVNEATDVLYLVVALGGKTTQIFAPLIAMVAEQPGRFIWSIFSFPMNYEGTAAMKRSIAAYNYLLSFTDMLLRQDNDKLSSISGLTFGEMNKPIVETFAQISQFDIRKHIRYKDTYDEFIPEKYRDAIMLYNRNCRYPRRQYIE